MGGGGDFGRGLVGELEFEFLEEELLVVAGLGVAAQDEGAAVGGGEVDIEHLDGGELVEDGSGGEAGGVLAQSKLRGISYAGNGTVGVRANTKP